MNTFFYAAQKARCDESCNYRTCCRRCLAILADKPFYQCLQILPGGSSLTTPQAMALRSGDIIIAYAEDRSAIDHLLALRDHLRTFRIILIFGEEHLVAQGNHYSLNPRYTTVLGRNMDELCAVIERITARAGCPVSHLPLEQEQHHV